MSTREWCQTHQRNCGGAWHPAREMMGESTCTDCGCAISNHSRRPAPEPGTQSVAEIIAETDQTLRMTLAELQRTIRPLVNRLGAGAVVGLEHAMSVMVATEFESLLEKIKAKWDDKTDPWQMTAGDAMETIQESIDGIRKGLE